MEDEKIETKKSRILSATKKNFNMLGNMSQNEWNIKSDLFKFKAYNLSVQNPDKNLLSNVNNIDPEELKENYNLYFRKKSLESCIRRGVCTANINDNESEEEINHESKEVTCDSKPTEIIDEAKNELIKQLELANQSIDNLKSEKKTMRKSEKEFRARITDLEVKVKDIGKDIEIKDIQITAINDRLNEKDLQVNVINNAMSVMVDSSRILQKRVSELEEEIRSNSNKYEKDIEKVQIVWIEKVDSICKQHDKAYVEFEIDIRKDIKELHDFFDKMRTPIIE